MGQKFLVDNVVFVDDHGYRKRVFCDNSVLMTLPVRGEKEDKIIRKFTKRIFHLRSFNSADFS